MQLGFRFRALALASAGLFVVAACGPSSGNGVTLASTQELRVRLTTEPATFDPGQQQWDYEAAVGRQTFEALLRTTKDGKDAVGAAADSYSIDSTGTIYTFKLHPGAKWSDGQPVKAADFVYAFQRLLDPRLDVVRGDAAQRQAVGDIGEDGAVRPQRIGLEDQPEIASFRRNLGAVFGIEEGLIAECDSTGIGMIQPGGRPQQGSLPAAGRAEERDHLASPQLEGDTLEHFVGAEAFVDIRDD